MGYPRCATCKHFDTSHDDPMMPEAWPGLCKLAEGPYDYTAKTAPSPHRQAVTIDGSTYTSSLLVTPDFGCVMHSTETM